MSGVPAEFAWTLPAFLLLFASTVANAGAPTVQIKNGTLSGLYMKTRLGREFAGFRGIPYALPPLGELRFEPPQPAVAWDGVKKAQENAAICTQRNIYTHQQEIVGSEDCLYLNVYTPKLPRGKDQFSAGVPVMIWFHGGGWVTGAGHSDFYGPKYLLDQDLILVTVNYRLGPLGFLSTEDLVCPGNQGMKDQSQAIRWVHENIAAFGGDPNRVTLFGESAGGASVHYHMMSSLSKGFFQRGISQSGHAQCPWTLNKPGLARKKANVVAKHLKCPTESSKDLIKCLKKKDAADVIGTDHVFQVFDYDPMIPFRPVIEPDHPGAFLKEDPILSSKLGRVADIPWMTGITSEEGTLRVPALYGLNGGKYIKQLDKEFEKFAPISLLYEDTCPESVRDDVSKKIREFYFGDKALDNSTRFDVINMYSDAWFGHAAKTAVRDYLETQSSPVYYYYFAYRGSASFSRIFGDPTQDYGVSHADELQYLFPVGEQLFPDVPLSDNDHKMIDILTTLWYNFANSGNPTPSITPVIPTKWKPVRTNVQEYLHIGIPKFQMSEHLLRERLSFWETLPVQREPVEAKDIRQEVKDEL